MNKKTRDHKDHKDHKSHKGHRDHKDRSGRERVPVGWREWVQLPGLGLPWIKAKVDSGARTSALHAFALEEYQSAGRHMVRFEIHPLQRDNDLVIVCRAPVLDRRVVSDSGGHREERLVIESILQAGSHRWPIELTLTCRDNMKFRMLLGRTAMENRMTIDPGASFLLGRPRGGARKAYRAMQES